MSTLTPGSALTRWAIQVPELLRGFGRWWSAELLAVFPTRVADWLVEKGSRSLVVALEDNAVVLQLTSDTQRVLASARINRDDYSPDAIDAFLQAHRQNREGVSLGISLPQESIFTRSVVLPLETRHSLDAIVVQDLVAKTPFQLPDIYHAHIARRAADQFVVTQCVVRRKHVDASVQAMGLDLADVTFIDARGAKGDYPSLPVIRLQQSPASQNHWVQKTSSALVVMALVLAVTAGVARHQRQQQVLDSLDAELASAKVKAKEVLAMVDRLQKDQARFLHLRSKKGETGLLDVWEETTRLLPTHSWLSELRMSETPEGPQVVMTGFSAAAASLVGLLDRSALFSEASLIGPISVDQVEGKERFTIQAKVTQLGPSKAASP